MGDGSFELSQQEKALFESIESDSHKTRENFKLLPSGNSVYVIFDCYYW